MDRIETSPVAGRSSPDMVRTVVARSLIEDAIAHEAPGMSTEERDKALRALDVLNPDKDGNLSYEDTAYLLGQTGNFRAAVALVRHLGPTEKELNLSPDTSHGNRVSIPRLVWPGPVKVKGNLDTKMAYVAHTLEVNGDMNTQGVAWVGKASVKGQQLGSKPQELGFKFNEANPDLKAVVAPQESVAELTAALHNRMATKLAARPGAAPSKPDAKPAAAPAPSKPIFSM